MEREEGSCEEFGDVWAHLDVPGLPVPASPLLSEAGDRQEQFWVEKSPIFPPQNEVGRQILGEQKLGLDGFPSRAGEGGWSRAQLDSSSRDDSGTFNWEQGSELHF